MNTEGADSTYITGILSNAPPNVVVASANDIVTPKDSVSLHNSDYDGIYSRGQANTSNLVLMNREGLEPNRGRIWAQWVRIC